MACTRAQEALRSHPVFSLSTLFVVRHLGMCAGVLTFTSVRSDRRRREEGTLERDESLYASRPLPTAAAPISRLSLSPTSACMRSAWQEAVTVHLVLSFTHHPSLLPSISLSLHCLCLVCLCVSFADGRLTCVRTTTHTQPSPTHGAYPHRSLSPPPVVFFPVKLNFRPLGRTRHTHIRTHAHTSTHLPPRTPLPLPNEATSRVGKEVCGH